MDKICQILMELSSRDTLIFSFQDDDLSLGVLTKLGTCIDTKEVWFGIANGHISSVFDRVMCPQHVLSSNGQYCGTCLTAVPLKFSKQKKE